MNRIPPLNLFGRTSPYVQQPYVPHGQIYQQPDRYNQQYNTKKVPSQIENRYNRKQDNLMYQKPRDQNQYPLKQQELENNKQNTNINDSLLPYYYKQDYHQFQNKQLRKDSSIPDQYGPPNDWYETSEMRKSLKPTPGQNILQDDSTQNKTQKNYSQNPLNPDKKPIYYPFIQPTLEMKKQTKVHHQDQTEQFAPIINFFPPEILSFEQQNQQKSSKDTPVDQQGRLNSFQSMNQTKNLNDEYTRYIQQQLQISLQYNSSIEMDLSKADNSVVRQKWEVEEIYSNLKATFDEKGNICFDNIEPGQIHVQIQENYQKREETQEIQ